ncbi:hypothetical protein DUNSADRAFT_13615 [Dunaliella salina]|uniref:Uncharacterized protein n=1 Tax=Dunaliella salina TaxID=3046 RepID=A0ABQ7G914_DUNSA|nr:hypothetical protein DUNSADRAFT_13615 [Dunaliella salina]|eukprot:KAF5831096.1 hypothetical protein DUNSADRAFT_13615 [Dunaliella salina]
MAERLDHQPATNLAQQLHAHSVRYAHKLDRHESLQTTISHLWHISPSCNSLCILQLRVSYLEQTLSSYPHLTICVITYNRLLALQRLLLSLNHARYHEHVDLRISVEAGAPSDLLRYVETFVWVHGSKTVHVRVVRAGLIPAVVESWFPANDNCYGVLLEDDLEVSPYFYEWLMFALAMIKKTDMHNRVFGISLYTPRVIETVNPYRTFLPDVEFPHSPAFLQQMPCSWGAMFFPDAWKKYIKYLHHRLIYNGSLLVPNSRTNGWVGSWKKYFVELAWAEALFMLYPNFKNQTSFSTNYVEQGAHVVLGDKLHTRSMYTVPLHTTDTWLKNQDFSFPLPLLDVLGNLYKAEKSANDLSKHSCQWICPASRVQASLYST